jgi:glutamate 5-kinase
MNKMPRTIVIKIGSALIADLKRDNVRTEWLNAFAADIKALTKQGKKIVVVSSGAVALGRKSLGISTSTPPSKIPLEQKQAASAVGQFHLFAAYFTAFSKKGLKAAQVLLTMSETENRRMHLNARGAMAALMDKNIIPIINENDTVSTGEIRFGDNDRLAVRVAQMIGADMVILLSTTDGLFTANPDRDKNAKHIPVVKSVTDEHFKMAGEAIPGLSTGGMKSKVEAAHSATHAGISMVITDGRGNHALKKYFENKNKRSTLFTAMENKSGARKKWIQSHLKPRGAVYIDDGALKALKGGKSLLPVGVFRVDGEFERGDIISVHDSGERLIGKGISAYSAKDAKMIMGKKKQSAHTIQGYIGRDELIHRNDFVAIG